MQRVPRQESTPDSVYVGGVSELEDDWADLKHVPVKDGARQPLSTRERFELAVSDIYRATRELADCEGYPFGNFERQELERVMLELIEEEPSEDLETKQRVDQACELFSVAYDAAQGRASYKATLEREAKQKEQRQAEKEARRERVAARKKREAEAEVPEPKFFALPTFLHLMYLLGCAALYGLIFWAW